MHSQFLRPVSLLDSMLTEANFKDLQELGYTVVTNVLSVADCDKYMEEFSDWATDFPTWPKSRKGIIHGKQTGHLSTTWQVRLKTKNVFSSIWKTDKLLTSFDSIAIGRPPEQGEEPFDDGNSNWLHLDQEPTRVGLNAYQGAVYLEEACTEDWTLQVMDKSHKVFQQFFAENPKAAEKSADKKFYRLTKTNVKYFEKYGCKIVRVHVPKGGMVLWDSRVVHDNAQPKKDRQNPGRWRYVVFVSMTPAVWASAEDIDLKQKAYYGSKMTNHWSSQGSTLMKATLRTKEPPLKMPEVAKTPEAQKLAGVIAYDFEDGNPNGPTKPLTSQSVKRKRDELSD